MKKLCTICCLLTVFMSHAQTGNVGIGTTSPAAKLHVAGSQIIDTTLQFSSAENDMPAMINLFRDGTENKPRMVLAHSAAHQNWGLQYVDSSDRFNFLSGGTPVLTTDLGSWRVGIGIAKPETRLDIAGTGVFNLATTEGDFRLGNSTYRLKMGVANAGGGAGDAYIASSHRLYLGAGSTLGRTQTMSINSNGTVGIGTASPSGRLQVVGDTVSAPVISAVVTYAGSSDVRGVTSFSKPADGWGYGVEGTGGFIGGYFSSLAGAYTGTGFGVFGTASGTAGTRVGVYGTASGGTVDNWGGFFPTKTYTSEIRVGGTTGAGGYVAAINGKLITTEIKVAQVANWSAGSGTNITAEGVRLPSPGGTPSLLDYYEEMSIDVSLTNFVGTVTYAAVYVVKAVRIGNKVTLTFPTDRNNLTIFGGGVDIKASTIPARFRPSAGQYFPILIRNTGNDAIGLAFVRVEGDVLIKPGGAAGFGNWSGIVNCGFYGFSMSYVVD